MMRAVSELLQLRPPRRAAAALARLRARVMPALAFLALYGVIGLVLSLQLLGEALSHMH